MIAVALDAILALVVIEAVALIALHRATGRGPALRDLLANLAAGFFLMLAVRVALTPGFSVLLLWACLTGALIAHVVDVGGRWRH